MRCPKCGIEAAQHIHGKSPKGYTRYQCSKCKKTYILEPPKYSEEFKKSAIQLYLEGNSGRAVGRILKIGKNTIWEWLREHGNALPEVKCENVEIAENDELYSYIKKGKSTISDDDGQ